MNTLTYFKDLVVTHFTSVWKFTKLHPLYCGTIFVTGYFVGSLLS